MTTWLRGGVNWLLYTNNYKDVVYDSRSIEGVEE